MEELELFSNLPDFISIVENVLLIYIPGWILLTIFFKKLSQSLSSVIKGILSVIISIILLRLTQGTGLILTHVLPVMRDFTQTKLYFIIGSLILSILTGELAFYLYRKSGSLHRAVNRALQGQNVQEETFSKGDELMITAPGGARYTGIFIGYFHQDTLEGVMLEQDGMTRIIPKASILSLSVINQKKDPQQS